MLGEGWLLIALISAREAPRKKQYILQESVTQCWELFHTNVKLPETGPAQRRLKTGKLTPPSAHRFGSRGKIQLLDLYNCL